MSDAKSKPLDVSLKGVKLDNEDAVKIDTMMKGVKLLDNMCDRLSRRMDAWEQSAKSTGFRDAR